MFKHSAVIFGICSIIFTIVFLLVMLISRSHNSSQSKEGRHAIGYMIIGAALLAAVFLLNPLNIIKQYSSPEAAMQANGDPESIHYIIDGEASCLVVAQRDDKTFYWNILLKEDNGFILAQNLDISLENVLSTDNMMVNIYSVSGTNDFYLIGIMNSLQRDVAPVDSLDSDFYIELSNVIADGNLLTYNYVVYSKLSDYTDNYWIELDNQRAES